MSGTTTFTHLRYLTALIVEVRHGYYDGGYCPHVTLEPSPACQGVLARYRLQFKQHPLGGILLGADPAPVPLPAADSPLTMEFYLRLRDPEFLAVTQFMPADAPVQGGFAYRYTFEDGIWQPGSGRPVAVKGLLGIAAILQVTAPVSLTAPATVALPLQAPGVEWTYYIVTGNNYQDVMQIAENGLVLSTEATTATTEAAQVAQRFPGKKLTTLTVTTTLKRNYPAWYLVTPAGGGPPQQIPDVPALPRPKPGAPPHIILDYAAILK